MRAGWLIALLASAGCTAVVGGPATPFANIPCEVVDGIDPCGVNYLCTEGFCAGVDNCDGLDNDMDGNTDEGRPMAPPCPALDELCIDGACVPGMPEICNDLDDDHDGMVDEGLDVDLDGDLYSTCNPDPSLRDCVDRPGVGDLIHPGATEVCDGYDNDCNPDTSDLDCPGDEVCATPVGGDQPSCLERMSCRLTGCPAGTRCDADTDRCVAIIDCTTSGCPIGQICAIPPEGGDPACMTAPAGPLGTACSTDAQCQSNLCVPYRALALTPTVPGALGICGASCCRHSDCAAFGSDAVCLAPGTGARSCVTRAVAGDAADVPLCTTSTCSGETCRISSASTSESSPLFNVFSCGPPVGSEDVFCVRNSDCRSGICNNFICRNPCGSGADCFERHCVFVPSGATDWVTVCGGYAGNAQTGDACSTNADCREGYCDPDVDVCRATCCSSASCAGGLRCAPVDNAGWEMRCLPNPDPGPG